MADSGPEPLVRDLQLLFNAGAAGGASDGQLLARFCRRAGDPEAEAAFAVLLARHGPMVLGVCRRALRDPNDADDAFQAVFLVLVRQAGSVRVEGSLGRWLYGVSRRVAARARADAARRAAREAEVPPPCPASADNAPERRELLEALDQEVARLAEPFRSVIVLCDLGGLTHEAAAQQLGCPVGTVESRLARGRKRLRDRLARRGFAPGLIAPAALGPLAPTLPESLALATTRAAMNAGMVPAATAALVDAVIKEMLMTQLRTLTLGVAAALLACGLGFVASQRLKAEPPRARRPATADRPPAPATGPIRLQPPAKIKPGDTLLIEVLEALPGRPISGTRLVRPDGTVSLGFYGDLKVAGLNREEIKVALIRHMRKYLTDDVLGLYRFEEPDNEKQAGRQVPVDPKDSDRVFVDDSLIYAFPDPQRSAWVSKDSRPGPADPVMAEKLERLRAAVADLAPAETDTTAARLAEHERRLIEIEEKLDRLVRAIEGMKGEQKP
jgi:RNA polymerase sigma factor (sigma-70 family)